MKTLYLECNMGAAGDMLNAALFELLDDGQRALYLQTVNNLLPGVAVTAEHTEKCGIAGTHIRVSVNGEEEHAHDADPHNANPHNADHESDAESPEEADGDCIGANHHHARQLNHENGGHHHGYAHHHGAHLHDIAATIEHFPIPSIAKRNAVRVYESIAQAEAHAHGKPVDQIHFHEVGSVDAIIDVTGFCLLMSMLSPARVVCSPICVGSGEVECAHGIVPVPAPATAYLLRDAPSYGSRIKGELCTPTGAALLASFADEYGPQPLMTGTRTGYGCGAKDFEAANVVRAMLGDDASAMAIPQGSAASQDAENHADDHVVELSCSIDDMTGEEIAFAVEELMDSGALDAFTTAITMKKGRPATMITCLCRPNDEDRIVRTLFKHTTTLGVRERLCARRTLAREEYQICGPFGSATVKRSNGYGAETAKIDYEDLAKIARENDMNLRQVRASFDM